MKLRNILISIALGLGISAHAQIPVDASGTAALIFDATPTVVAAEWASITAGLGAAGAGTFTSPAEVDGAVQTLDQSTVTRTLDRITANGTFASARHNTSAGYLVTQPTTVAAQVLKATLRNTSGQAISHLTVSYDFGVPVAGPSETAPGHRVFFSTNGLPNSWEPLPNFSGLTAAASVSSTLFVGTWLPNTDLYIVFADDNAATNPDGGYSIDNFAVSGVVITNTPLPLSVVLTAPANGSIMLEPTNVTINASTSGSTPANSVSFFTNGVLAATDTIAPYSVVLPALAAGTYAIHATASNGVDPDATSTTSTITVLPVINYAGGTITENFDGMGEAGTTAPIGWYVSAAPPITSVAVTVGDGSAGAAGAILGWNYGTTASSDRALGTAPTGAERNMAVAIQNNTGSTMTSMEIHFDGEVWRTYTNNLVGVISNYVSVDLGATWVPTGLKFEQPFLVVEPQSAVDGNATENRTADINAIIGLPAPVPSGAVLLVRWWDANEGGTDGGLAIDNFSFRGGFDAFVASATLTTPTNGATFAEAANITLAATANMAATITNMAFFHDAVLIGNDTTAPYSAVYSNATLGAHTLTATASDNAGNSVTTTNTVVITVNPNVLPTVTLATPAAGSEFLVGVTITNISATATDTDGTIARVEFYLDGVLLTSDTSSAYGYDLCSPTAGAHQLAAVAVDNANGRSATNAISITVTNPPAISVILPNGSMWNYFDQGTDPGATWNSLSFNDSGWSNGVAELGYGDAPGRPERTTVGFGPASATKYPATYFRKAFTVANAGAYTNLILNILKDDHAVVYLNGTQIYSDMTNEVVNYLSLCPPAIAQDGTLFDTTNVPVNLLVSLPNTNILAVEVHQDTANSSDISFDLMLWGQEGSTSPKPSIAFDTANNKIVITWSEVGLKLQQKADLLPGAWTDAPGANTVSPYSINLPTGTPVQFFKLVPQ